MARTTVRKMPMLTYSIAHNVRYLVRRSGMDDKAFAKTLGIGVYKLRSYMEGRARPPVYMLIKFKEYSGCTIDDLILTKLK